MRLAAAAALVVVLQGCLAYSAFKPAPELPEGARVLPNLAYAPPGADADRNRLDLYVPAGPGPHPVIVFVHGGYWQNGGRQKELGVYVRLGKRLAARGILAVVISYRLSPRYRHPVHIEDVARAIATTFKNAPRYGGDPKRIYLVGHSAGGHLVTLSGLDPRWLRAYGIAPSRIAGVVSISGIYDIEGLAAERFGGPNVRRTFGRNVELWKRASPIHHVSLAARPKMLLAIGDGDPPFLRKQHAEMAAALGDVESVEIADRSHSTIVTELFADDDPLGEAILRFMRLRP